MIVATETGTFAIAKMIMRDLVGAGQRSGKGCCIHQAGPCTTPGVFIDYPDCSGQTALSPQADIYVSDGYQNARVHKYSPDGKLLFSWGEPGTDAGQFNLVHNIACDDDSWVYVADRENHCVKVFDGNGKYQTQWNNLMRPCGLLRGARIPSPPSAGSARRPSPR
jgi:hypothetical protein